ncbi:MAG: nucleoid-associated protein [Verrucomicrobiae bacterium]|nr:nucleoid-associated protein [Verrucomicrobiae bacterium]
MRFLSDITVEQAIAHHIDHLTPEIVISRRLLKLTDELHFFLNGHLTAVSRLSSLIPARFHEEPGEVASVCRAVLSGEGKLAPLSSKIADRLFKVMGTNRTLSPGLLLVVLARNNENKERFISILKMESQPVFKEQRIENPDGETSIELSIDRAALPAPGRHLQKCAFIKTSHSAARPEILLLDKQAGESAMAGFFREQFLQAEYCRDSHYRTKQFMNEFVKWANKAGQEHRLTPVELDQTIHAARHVLKKPKITVTEFVQDAIENRGEQASCLEQMARRKVDPQFETAPKVSERFRRTRMVKLDHGAILRMPEAATLDKNFYTTAPDPDDQTVTIVTLRTRRYQVM